MKTNGFDTKNNVIKTTNNGKVENKYDYEYDDAEYPIKRTKYNDVGTKVET